MLLENALLNPILQTLVGGKVDVKLIKEVRAVGHVLMPLKEPNEGF